MWSPLASDEKFASPAVADAPGASDAAAAAAAVLPLDPDGAFMRRWSAADLQYDALHALWLSKGNAGEAEVALIQQHGEPWKASTLAQDTALGVTLTTAIIECRKDLARAHHALNSRGTKISMNALQRWYYAQFRRDTETIALSTAIDAEMDTDDGLEDHCSICGNRGELLVCDGCSSVYHLACVGLREIPEGEWRCYLCLTPPTHGCGSSALATSSMFRAAGRGRGGAVGASRSGPGSAAGRGRGGSMPPPQPGKPGKPQPAKPQPRPVPVGGAAAPRQPPPAQPLPIGGALPMAAAPVTAGATAAAAAAQNGKRKAPDGGHVPSAPSKRIFRTAEGRAYEQDIFTGAVTWLDPPTAMLSSILTTGDSAMKAAAIAAATAAMERSAAASAKPVAKGKSK